MIGLEPASDVADRHERAKGYLAPNEMLRLLEAAEAGRHGVRDHLLMLMTYPPWSAGQRSGWPASRRAGPGPCPGLSALSQRWSVCRAAGRRRRATRHLATRGDALPWLFPSERGRPMTRQAINCLVTEAAGHTGLPGVHPHTLRHFCGCVLADKGFGVRLLQDYLGHCDPRQCRIPHPHGRTALRAAVAGNMTQEVRGSWERLLRQEVGLMPRSATCRHLFRHILGV